MKRVWTCSAMLALCGLAAGATPLEAQTLPVSEQASDPERGTGLELRAALPLPAGAATDAHNNIIVSNDGRTGFLAAAFGDSVYAFNTITGELISSINTGSRASRLSIFENGERRLLAVVNLNEPGEPASVAVLDATDARNLSLVSAFILPSDVTLAPTVAPVFDRAGLRVAIASSTPGAIFLFETLTGQMLERIDLRWSVDSLAVVHRQSYSIVGAVSAEARTVTIFDMVGRSLKRQQHFFELPAGFGLLPANNLCFNADGSIGYIASFEGDRIFSFDTATGILIDSYEVGDGPAQLAWSGNESGARLAVVNTGIEHGFLANSVSIVETLADGRFGTATVFLPAPGTDLTPDSALAFTARGDVGMVGSASGSLFVFDAVSGEQITEARLKGQANRFAIGMQGGRLRVMALATTPTSDRVNVLRLRTRKAKEPVALPVPATAPPPLTPTVKIEPTEVAPESTIDKVVAPAPTIDRVYLRRVRRGLRLIVEGDGFERGTRLVINNRSVLTTFIDRNHVIAYISWGFIGPSCELDIKAQRPSGDASTHIRRRLIRRTCR